MSQLKFYKYATFGLLFLNLSMIAFFFLTKPAPPLDEARAHQKAIEFLDLDKNQQDKFLQSARRHHAQMPPIEEQQKEALQNYFHSLIDASSNEGLAPALEKIVQLEQQKVELTYQHFKEIRTMLKPEQLDQFESFMAEVLKKLLSPQRKKKHE